MTVMQLVREQLTDALTAIQSTTDPNTKAYYEGRRDVLAELLNTAKVLTT